MSDLDSSAIRAYSGAGGIYVADLGTPLPTDAVTALDADFEPFGYLDDTGVVLGNNNQTTDIFAWQNGDLVRRLEQSHDGTVGFTPMETNPVVLEAFFGNFVGTMADGEVRWRGGLPPRKAWVVQAYDGDEIIRGVLAEGQLTQRGQLNLSNKAVTGYPMTITGYPSSDLDGDKGVFYYATNAVDSA